MKRDIISVADAIAVHTASFLHEETLYDLEGTPVVDAALICAADLAEIEAFRDFIHTPCLTGDDVQAKLRYLEEGLASASQPVSQAILDGERYDDDTTRDKCDFGTLYDFLASLRIHAAEGRGN